MDRGRLYKTPLGHYYTSQSKILFLHTQFTSTVTHEKLLHLNYSFDCDNLRASNYFRINLVRNLTRVVFFSSHSNAREEALLSNCRDGRVTSFGNNNSVLNVSNNLARPAPALSASARMSQSEWQEAVANHIAKSDDLTLCPGSELLSPIEKQVGDRSTHLFVLFSNVSFFLYRFRFAKVYV